MHPPAAANSAPPLAAAKCIHNQPAAIEYTQMKHFQHPLAQPLLREAQPRQQAAPAQQAERYGLQRPPVCQLRQAEYVKRLPVF